MVRRFVKNVNEINNIILIANVGIILPMYFAGLVRTWTAKSDSEGCGYYFNRVFLIVAIHDSSSTFIWLENSSSYPGKTNWLQ